MPSEEQYRALEKRISFLERLERPQEIEYRIAAQNARKGSSAPADANRAVGASGGVLVPVIQFSSVTQQDVYFVFHVPVELDANKKIYFHFMWCASGLWGSGNYDMKLEYLVKDETGVIAAGAPTTLEFDLTPANNTNFFETEDATGITVAPDQMVLCHFYRDVANDNGDGTFDLLFFEFEYWTR